MNILNDLNEYIKIFFSLDNLVFYALIFIIAIVLLVKIVYEKQFKPTENKWFEEKQKIKAKNDKIMALFAEFDPNPLIRVDIDGNIIKFNDSAARIFDVKGLEFKLLLKKIFPNDFSTYILGDMNISAELNIKNCFYSVEFKGIKDLGIGQIYFSDLTEIKNKEIATIESEQKYKQLSVFLQDQLEEEKQRIGMELHDSIGQNLLFVNLKLSEAIETKNFNGKLSEVKEALDNTIIDVRNTMMDLKPRILYDMGLYSAIYDLTQRVSLNSGIIGSVDVSGKEIRFNEKSELYIYRIIQEATNNIIKHSHAKEFNIQLIYAEDKLKVLISDDGIGFDIEKLKERGNKGNGLFNMVERIKDLDGSLQFDSNHNEGTMISFEIFIKEIIQNG